MGQRDSKYDIVIDSLKKYQLNHNIYFGCIYSIGNISYMNQLKKIYHMLNDPYIKIYCIEQTRYCKSQYVRTQWISYASSDLFEVIVYTTNLKYTLYIHNIDIGERYFSNIINACFNEIISKNKERYKSFIMNSSIPNDIKWLICEYI